MAKFCGKCGSPLNENGLCPQCSAAQINDMQKKAKAQQPQQTAPGNKPEKPVKMTREQKKAAKKAEKKRRKKEKRAAMTTGQKIKRFFLKLLALLLALAILAGSVSCTLVYFDIADIPFVEKIMGWFGYEKRPNSLQNGNNEVPSENEEADEDMSSPYYVDPIDADDYYGNNTQIVEKIKSTESTEIHTEAEAFKNLTERGFTQYPISAIYNMNGDYVETEVIAETSGTQHPMYQTFFVSDAGEMWSIFEINGAVLAEPLSFMEQNGTEVPYLFSEKETSTSYDSTTNTFFITIPNDTTTILKKVNVINAETLNSLTNEVIAGL